MSKQLKFEMGYCSDYCEWDDVINVHISDELQYRIDKARKIMESDGFIKSMDLDAPDDFLDRDTWDRLQEQCRFDVDKLIVYPFGVYFYIQCKYDCSIQAEYGEVDD